MNGEGILARAWRGLLLFLEVIGLREEGRTDQESTLARFRLHHTEFRKLLSANNALLETIAELERKSTGTEYFDSAWVERRVVRAVTDVHAMVESLAAISDDRHPALRDALRSITAALTGAVARPKGASPPLVLDLPDVLASHADLVGGKMANLGEVRNGLGLPTPDGFAVTTEAFRLFLDEAGLTSSLLHAHGEVGGDGEGGSPRQAILAAALPPSLASEIAAAYDRLAARGGAAMRVAARSSAIGEDGARSFAGQFLTVLNLTRDNLVDAYRRVVASLYSPEAVQYRSLHGIPPESAAMAVGFVAMIDAAASGVAFSCEPTRAASGNVLVHAVHGLGVALVEGEATPESIVVAATPTPAVVSRTPGLQASELSCGEGGGVVAQPIDPAAAAAGALSDSEACEIARRALALAAHFGCPQDVEWARDRSGLLWVLQSRPLRVAVAETRETEPLPGEIVLLVGGDTACPGVGCGTVVVLGDDDDLDAFPEGGVLVARRPSPRFVRIMARTRAIVTDVGSTMGHMASLARELRVPALVATHDATRALPAGALVTVDAASRIVYRGKVDTLLERAAGGEERLVVLGSQAPEMQLLRRISELIVPLHLADPRSYTFAAEGCRTLHDLARFVHEKSYEEMFRMGERLSELRPASRRLDVFLPIDLFIVDLGGGLAPSRAAKRVKPADVRSTPLAALLRGMLDQRIPRFGPRPMDVGGFLSVVMRHAMASPEEERTFRDPCYALVSDCYINYTARVGYHFGVVDAYCSETPNKNYIAMRFKGGAADRVRRARRARAIAGVLREHGFAVRLILDLVSARLSKPTLAEAVSQLEMLGRLFQFFRQMDAAMTSDAAADAAQEAFLSGNLSYWTESGSADGS